MRGAADGLGITVRWVRAGLLVLVWLVAGCSSAGTATPPQSGAAAPSPGDRLQPLTALGPCTQPDITPDPAAEAVATLVLPADAIATTVVVQDPLTTVEGWIPATPLQVQAHYADHPDLEVITLEDEVWESESLLTDGTNRLFLKVQAVCDEGSLFVAVIAPDDAAEALPTPAGR